MPKNRFNVFLGLTVIILSVIIGIQSWSCSYTELTLAYDGNLPDGIKYEMEMDDGSLQAGTAAAGDGNITIPLYNYGLSICNMRLYYETGEPVFEKLSVMSRGETVAVYKLADTDYKCTLADGGHVKGEFGEKILNRVNSACRNDWRLKLEVILIVVLCAVVLKVVEIAVRKRIYKNLACVAAAAYILILAGVFFSRGIVYSKEYLNITKTSVTDVLTQQEEYYQTFVSDNRVYGVSIRFATYLTTIRENYELLVYDAETDELLLAQEIEGENIIDNEKTDIYFENSLEPGIEYKFTVVQTDSDDISDTLSIWKSDVDEYDGGTIIGREGAVEGDLDFDLIIEGPNIALFSVFIIIAFTIAAFLCYFYERKTEKNKWNLVFVYGIVFLISLFKMYYCSEYTELGKYDEMAQISYIAYFEENPTTLIPQYEDAVLLISSKSEVAEDLNNVVALEQFKGVFEGQKTGTPNYLGHPSLYYHIMRLTNSVAVDGDIVKVDLDRLRVANVLIVIAAIFIIFYIGYTRIRGNAFLHLLYAMLCTSVPIICYEAVCINNDNLNLLAVAIFILGCMRIAEKKRNPGSYWLVAIGIGMATLTKLTAGMMLGIVSLVFVAFLCISEKNLKCVINWRFLSTIPLYLAVAVYFIMIYKRYGTFQPSVRTILPEQYLSYPVLVKPLEEREYKDIAELLKYFCHGFWVNWSNGEVALAGKLSWFYAISRYPIRLFLVFPLLIFGCRQQKSEEDNMKLRLYQGAVGAVFITLFMQFIKGINDFYNAIGRIATQSRYYACMIPFLAITSIFIIENIYKTNGHKELLTTKSGYTLTVNAVVNVLLVIVSFILLFG